MRVFVAELLIREQRAALLHVGKNRVVRLFVVHTRKLARIGCLVAAVINRNQIRQVVAATGHMVVGTEAARRVDAAGTAVHRHIVGSYHQRLAVEERMLRGHVFEVLPFEGRQLFIGADLARLHRLLAKRIGNQIAFAVFGFDQHIIVHRAQGNRLVAGQRPGRGCPDDKVGPGEVAQPRQLLLVVLDPEFDINRGAFVGPVFNLRFCQRGLVMRAPVDRLHALVDIPALVHLAEDLDFPALKRAVHGQIRMLPIGADAQALELLALAVNEILRKLVAGFAELRNRHFLAVQLVLLDNCRLNGHTVVVPARDIRHAVTGHQLGFVDEILQNLVHRRAHVDVAVRERRSVMQHEKRLALAVFLHEVVEVNRLPVFQHFRLPLRQTRAHGEIGYGEVERACVILCHFPSLLTE